MYSTLASTAVSNNERQVLTTMKITVLSKQDVRRYKPQGVSALIAINDLDEANNARTYVSRFRYKKCFFHFFDDVLEFQYGHLSIPQGRLLYHHIQSTLATQGLDEIVIHCHAGYSRSRAVASFITKYLLKDEAQFEALKVENGGFAGNPHVLNTLIKIHQEEKGE